MEIKRQNVDFGNSIFQTLVDGYYFEIPTNVVEITKDKAEKATFRHLYRNHIYFCKVYLFQQQ